MRVGTNKAWSYDIPARQVAEIRDVDTTGSLPANNGCQVRVWYPNRPQQCYQFASTLGERAVLGSEGR